MQKHNLNVLIEYDDERFNPKVLMNEPGYRIVLLSMRSGQLIPEHALKGAGHGSRYPGTRHLVGRTLPK